MKCRYCNAEVAPNAKFCTTCGGDLSKFDKCVSCGEYIDKGITKCPHCGAEQPQIVQHQEGSPSKGLWIIGTILLLGILGGGGYYFLNNMDGNHSYVQETDSIEEVVDSLIDIENIHSVEGIKARLNDILNNGLGMDDEAAIMKYFSKEFRDLNAKVAKIDETHPNEIGFWEGSIWDGSQDANANDFTINSVKSSTDTKAYAQVKFIHSYKDYHSENLITVDLVFENDTWYVDDINGNKSYMKEYINQNNSEVSPTALNGKYTLIGKVSKYGIHMYIEFDGPYAKGYYYYDSQGSGNKVNLIGSINEVGELTLKKYSEEGEDIGYFEGLFNGIEYSGKNVNYNRDEDLQFSVTVE